MIVAFLLGAFGAVAAEILQRWKQFNDIPEDHFRRVLGTLKFWSVTLFLVLLGGIGGLLAVSDYAKVDWKVCFLGGVGAMALVRNTLSGAAAQAEGRSRKGLRRLPQAHERLEAERRRPGEHDLLEAETLPGDLEAMREQYAHQSEQDLPSPSWAAPPTPEKAQTKDEITFTDLFN